MKLVDLLDIQRYVRSVAAKAGMDVQYEDTAVPYTTPGKVHLPNLNQFTTEEQLAEYLYFIEHESAHAAYSDFSAIAKYKPETLSCRVMGILEDYRIDNKDARWYDGFKQNRAQVLPTEIDKMRNAFDTFMEGNPKAEHADEAEKLVAAHAWTLKHDETHSVAAEYERLVANANIQKWIDKLDAYAGELPTLVGQDSHAAAALADKIIEHVFGQDPEQDKQPEDGEGEGKGEGEQGEGKGGKPKANGNKGGEGEAEGKGEGEEGDDDAKDGEGFGNHYDHKSGVPQGVARGKNKEPKETRRIKITYSSGKFVPCLPTEYNVVRLADGVTSMRKVTERAGFGSHYNSVADEATWAKRDVQDISTGTVDGFAQQVRRLLQIRSRSRYEYGQKKGKLDQSRLARLGMRDAPGFNERVFKRKIIADTTDTAVLVLLDASGSMHGSKWAHAIKSAELINATVSRALGIPLEVLAFTDDNVGSIIYEGKVFSELRVGDEQLVDRLSLASGFMSGNADGEAVLFAYNRLRVRKEKRKVLIVVSDGAPACSPRSHGGGRIDEFTAEVIKEIEADPRVDIYGLGIMSHSVCEYYKHNVVVSRGDSLEQALLTLIDKSIA